jgi:hypothetical protein
MTSLERSIAGIIPFLGIGLLAALPMLLVDPGDDPLSASIAHLVAVVLLGLAATLFLAPSADASWYGGTSLSEYRRLVISAAGVVALVTGMVALVTLATGAAIGFQPSLQFLQLLSALDIAWAGAALMIGLDRWVGRGAAVFGGLVLAVTCVGTIWRYLDTVGFAPDGGWIVDGDRLMTLVIPFDMVAGVVAVAVLLIGTRRAQRTEQASPQS